MALSPRFKYFKPLCIPLSISSCPTKKVRLPSVLKKNNVHKKYVYYKYNEIGKLQLCIQQWWCQSNI